MNINEPAINIAILSSFTARGIEDCLRGQCKELGLNPSIYLGGYNQYVQEILGPASALYASNPQLIILFLDTRALLGDYFFLPYQMSDDDRRRWVEHKAQEIISLVETVKRNCRAKVLLHNFEIPLHSPLGILEHKQPFGFKESIEALNAKLRDAFKNDSQVFLFDFDAFCAKVGKQHVLDHKMYYLGDIKLHVRHLPDLCSEYMAYIKPMLHMTKKCIVLDLDNTLWGGIVGEDGMEGIKLGPTPEGRPFWEFQKSLLALLQRGVILAVNSKNNPEEVARVFAEHPYMVLKEEHFAVMRINWGDKVANMKSLAEEIGIGLDSLVFFDDDPVNRAMIQEFLPEVMVVDLPADPALYIKTVHELDAFHTLQLTKEDRERGKIYAQERQRKGFEQVATDLTEYLRGLGMRVTIEQASPITIPRIAQLTQKTNQFNMTTRRYSEEEIARLAVSPQYLVVSLRAQDKFGDNGTVGVAIAEKGNPAWRIDDFLLSCRVIGRRIEETLLAYIVQEAHKSGVASLTGEFMPTKKNAPAKGFYEKNGFALRETIDGKEMWEYDIERREYPYTDFIQVVTPPFLPLR